MSWQAISYAIAYAALAAALAVSAGYALRRRRMPGSSIAAAFCLGVSWWLIAAAATLLSTDLRAKLIWTSVSCLAIAILPAFWLAYAIRYTGRGRWLRPRGLALLAAEPATLLALVATNDLHGWVWSGAALVPAGGLMDLELTYGLAFWAHVAYTSLIVIAALVLFSQAAARSPRLYRRQSLALAAAVLLPIVAAVAEFTSLNPFAPLELFPLAIGLDALLVGWSLRRLRYGDLVPAARGAVINSIADAVIVLDARDRIVELNPAARALLGPVKGQSIQATWRGWPEPGKGEQEQPAQVEIVLPIGVGDRVFDLSLSPLLDWRGRLAGRVAVAREVTRRKQAEEALQDSEARYRAVLEQSAENIYLADVETLCILEANAALHAFLGYEPGSLQGRPISTFVDHAPQDIAAKLQRVLEEGHLFMGERHYRRRDGSRVDVEVNGSIITYRGKRALTVVSRDITERKRAAEALTQHNRDLQQLNAAAWALNASLSVEQVLDTAAKQCHSLLKARACSMWLVMPGKDELVCSYSNGPSREKMLGLRVRIGSGLLGWVALSGASLLVADTLADPESQPLEWPAQANMSPRSVLAVPLLVKQEVIGVIQVHDSVPNSFTPKDLALAESLAAAAAVALDNARLYEDLKLRMDDLRRTQAQLVQTAKMAAFGELAAGVAHELNNPLQPIMGYTELLLEKVDGDDWVRKDLSIILREARRARGIVRSLVEFAGQAGAGREPADVNEVIREALGLVTEQLREKLIVVDERYAPGLPPLLLDCSRLKQVFLNLITNASLAMPGGGTLTVVSEPSGDGVAVRIRDTGTGIGPEHLSHIFEPFFTTRPVGQGTGLGLSVSLGIVREHGGRIDVQSKVGEGSEFTVWLPLEAPPARPAGAPLRRQEAQRLSQLAAGLE